MVNPPRHAFFNSALVSDRFKPEVMVEAEPSEQGRGWPRFGPLPETRQGARARRQDQRLSRSLLADPKERAEH